MRDGRIIRSSRTSRIINDMIRYNRSYHSRNMSKREAFYQVVKSKGGICLDPYINARTKVRIVCPCGNMFSPIPDTVKRLGTWCPVCARNDTHKAEREFREIVIQKGGEVLGEYINTHTGVKIRCPANHSWLANPSDIKIGRWCPKCMGVCPIQAREQFMQVLKDKGGELLSPYIDAITKVTIKCGSGHSWQTTPSSVKNSDTWCPKCNDRCPIQAYENFIKVLEAKGGTLLSKYISTNCKVKIRCQNLHEWWVAPATIKSGKWCPHCNISKGEEACRNFFLRYQIPFQEQFIIPQLPKKKFDFYFYYNSHHYLVEYDGVQHFEWSTFFHKTEEEFLVRQKIDAMKYQIPTLLGYYMIRIDHTQLKDVESHLHNAITSNQQIYLSNPSMYSYLTQQLTTNDLLLHASEDFVNSIKSNY